MAAALKKTGTADGAQRLAAVLFLQPIFNTENTKVHGVPTKVSGIQQLCRYIHGVQ
jgi:hypothetical protein